MGILSEEEVYNGAKRWLRRNGFAVIAGQPARGVDHLPVVEIKRPTGNRGSRDAYKPDLVAYRDGRFYIIECKPAYDAGDAEKISGVLASDVRKESFYTELRQYHLLERVGYGEALDRFCASIEGILAHGGSARPDSRLHQLIVSDWRGEARWVD